MVGVMQQCGRGWHAATPATAGAGTGMLRRQHAGVRVSAVERRWGRDLPTAHGAAGTAAVAARTDVVA